MPRTAVHTRDAPEPTTGTGTAADNGLEMKQAVARHLTAFLDRRRRAAIRIDAEFTAEVVERLESFVLDGGKRIRPTFAWWGWRAAGGCEHGAAATTALQAASALELIQACALIQDDVMDGSDVRRGRPAIHVAFADAHRDGGWPGDPHQYGRSAAVLAGDLALVWADDMLADALKKDPAAWTRAHEPWHAMRTEMIAGQFLDVRAQARADEAESTALRVNRLKTAAYSVERPLHFGAALADEDGRLVGTLREYGAAVGSAFQLRDDLLDLYGDPAQTGKPLGGDLREGKRTLLLAVGLREARQRGDPEALETLTAATGSPGLTERDVREIADLLHDLGAKDAVLNRLHEHLDDAVYRISEAPIDASARAALHRLAHGAAVRSH